MVKLAPGYNETPSVALCNNQNTLSRCGLYLSHRGQMISKGAIDVFKDKEK